METPKSQYGPPLELSSGGAGDQIAARWPPKRTGFQSGMPFCFETIVV